MKREFCGSCVLKHAVQARVLALEARKGYPVHRAFSMGHLAEAEDEALERMPETAARIREERLKMEKDLNYMPDWEELAILIGTDAMLPGYDGGIP